MKYDIRNFIIIMALLFVMVSFVSASVYQYFGRVDNNIEVKQTLDIDGRDWNDYIQVNKTLYSGESYSDSFTINNNAPDINANISVYISGLPQGMSITFYHNNVEFSFPIQLNAGQSYNVTYVVSTDMNLYPANYTVRMYFDGDEI